MHLFVGWSGAGWWSTVATIDGRSDADDSLVDGGFNAVVLLDVKLWQLVVFESRGFLDITKGRGVNDVSDQESLDGLILWDSLGGGGASTITEKSGISHTASERIMQRR